MKPHAVCVAEAAPTPAGWSARFSAIGRHYRYEILNRPVRPVLGAGLVWHVPRPLDADAMARAALYLLGTHDFTSFRANACQAKSPIKTLERLDVTRVGDRLVILAEARSFLHHQVRNMVGSLKLVGDGSWPEQRIETAIAARDRSAAGPTAPPEGLTLTRVIYPTEIFPCPTP
jgi:tRNA pseudouridine38-40 synthase